MISNWKEHGFEVRADILPEACTACPFWLYSIRTNTGMCDITGHEIEADGSQDEERMNDCPIRLKDGWIPTEVKEPDMAYEAEEIEEFSDDVLISTEYGEVSMAYNRNGYSNGWEDSRTHQPITDKVTAWQPLPNPYRKEKWNGEE
jgi:hypothetical protein